MNKTLGMDGLQKSDEHAEDELKVLKCLKGLPNKSLPIIEVKWVSKYGNIFHTSENKENFYGAVMEYIEGKKCLRY
uniref:Uncharacterized protein n=1 Tax=Ditylenchus dipsaci TaxID=166011 RepID=A0A915CVB0_9BILA